MPHKTNFWKSINQSIIRPSYHVMKVKGSPTRKYTVNKYPPTTFPIQNLEKLMEVPHNPESYTYLSPMAFHTHEPLLSLAKLPWTCLINKSNNYKKWDLIWKNRPTTCGNRKPSGVIASCHNHAGRRHIPKICNRLL